jgi:archaellum component FlaC
MSSDMPIDNKTVQTDPHKAKLEEIENIYKDYADQMAKLQADFIQEAKSIREADDKRKLEKLKKESTA